MGRKKNPIYSHPLQWSLFDEPAETEWTDSNIRVTPGELRALREESRRRRRGGEEKAVDADNLDLAMGTSEEEPYMVFISFGSGSSGNCTYIGTREEGVLVDAGVAGDTVSKGLKDNGLSMDNVKAIILTHDHSDHVRFAYAILRKYRHIALCCTPKALGGLLRRHSISRRIKDYHKPFFKEFPFEVGGLKITAFETMHDGTDNCGFFIQCGELNFCVATDLGCVSPRVEYYMQQAQFVMLEANYDPEMLKNGPYPQYLKARIAFDNGHLSNHQSGEFLARLAAGGMKYVFLCHLSQDNNTPELAVATVLKHLADAGFTEVGRGTGIGEDLGKPLQVVALPRFDVSPMYLLR